METLDLFNGITLSSGLESTLKKINQLKKEKKYAEAYNLTIEAINMVRISGAALRCELAKQIREGKEGESPNSINSAHALLMKATEHLNREDPSEKKVITAIKEQMFEMGK